MDTQEILKKIRNLEIKTRMIVESTFTGEYHSVFKGRGISFSEVREYQMGDDVRQIDWNVTAKMGSPYIKLFEEERELTVILMVDLSASGNFGSYEKAKSEIAAEIAAILGFSANNNKDKVGLILFSDQVEKSLSPKKGKDHVLHILREIFFYKPESKKTSIANALDYLVKTNKKKSIVFMISYFLDSDYEKVTRLAAKKHDLIPIIIEDSHELELPKAGTQLLEDEETGEQLYINMSSNQIRENFQNIVFARQTEQDRFFRSINAPPVRININKPYLSELRQYFKNRSKKR